jgi:integrase
VARHAALAGHLQPVVQARQQPVCATRLNELGFASDWIERQLAHAEPNAVRRTYNHAEYLGDRAKMMQQWADMLDTWKKGDENVTPIKRVAA